MRVGIVAHELPRDTVYGGVGRYIEEFVPGLVAAGVEVHAFAPAMPGTPRLDVPIAFGHRTIRLPDDLLSSPTVELEFVAWLRDVQPDLVHFHHVLHMSFRLPELCVQQGVPYVLHVHDMTYFCNQTNLVQNLPLAPPACDPPTTPLERCAGCLVRQGFPNVTATPIARGWREYGRAIVEGAHTVVWVSAAVRAIFEAQLGYAPQRSRVMLPALPWPQRVDATPRADGAARVTHFAFLGHVNAIKGLDTVLDALELIGPRDDLEVHVHGEVVDVEPYRTNIQAQLARVTTVRMHGRYGADELPRILADSDWLLCASRFEASPLVVHEAASVGLPQIGPDIGGVPEKIGEGGLLYAPSDAASLAAVLLEALDPAVQQRCAQRVQAVPQIPQQLRETLALYDEVVADGVVDASATAPRVSVVLPSHNSAARLRACVERLIEAGFSDDDELIVVDDGSTDDTPVFLQVLEGSVATVRNPVAVGFARAANQGAARARGRFVAFLHVDTVVEPGWLDRLVDAAERTGAQAVGATVLGEAGEEQLGATRALPLSVDAEADREVAATLPATPVASSACMLVERHAFAAMVGFDESYRGAGEDTDLCWRLARAGCVVTRTDDVVVRHAGMLGSLLPPAHDPALQQLVARWRQGSTVAAV